ncbi:MAG: methyltransferase domain-containing protein [Chlorobiaceae bacterium]|nr:methyltransferase domain-containing protein [Chlorobiaceae bacterium]
MSNFTEISHYYRHNAELQKSAGERLFSMAAIGKRDDVLDLGCGPGHLTSAIRQLTEGRVMGIDPSQGMIDMAQNAYPDESIAFRTDDAEHLGMTEQFDLIFCNSTFQWFREPDKAVSNCFRALRSGGRMAVQAPAKINYCPNFIHAAESLLHDKSTRDTFLHFRSPWVFFDTAEEYAAVFERAGFSVTSSEISELLMRCPPGKVLDMFDTGAAAAYLNQECYDTLFAGDYVENARRVIARDFDSQAGEDNLVTLSFSRIYLLAQKP